MGKLIINVPGGEPDFLAMDLLDGGSFEDYFDLCGDVMASDDGGLWLGDLICKEIDEQQVALELIDRKEDVKAESGKMRKETGEDKISMNALAERFLAAYYVRNIEEKIYIFDDELNFYRYANQNEILSKLRDVLSQKELNKLTYRSFDDAIKFLQAFSKIKLEERPIYRSCVLFENGFFDICTGKEIEYDPARIQCFYKINANFHPKEKLEAPYFEQFLEYVSTGDKQVIRRIWEFLGYCLIPDQDAKCFFYLGTEHDSGKSVLAEFLTRLVGKEFVSAVALQELNKDFYLAPLVGKTLNLCMDLSSKALKPDDVSQLKKLTGGDMLNVNEKYKSIKSHKNSTKFVFGSNYKLQLSEDDDALWERLVVVPFLQSTPKEKQDKKLAEKFWQERDAIVTKAMFAVRRVIGKNYIFSECLIADRMKTQWQNDDQNSVMRFIGLRCSVGDKDRRTHTEDLYSEYLIFCDEAGYEPVTKNRFPGF